MSSSLRDFGYYWPDRDKNPQKNYDWVKFHVRDVLETVKRCKKRRTVVQAGGHVGLWPESLAGFFQNVYTFEPDHELYECLEKNMRRYSNVRIGGTALSMNNGTIRMRPANGPGSSRVQEGGAVEVITSTIDVLNLDDCDAIMLDIEGHEVEALMGALHTIRRCRPVITVELGISEKVTVDFMRKLRYRLDLRVHKDAIYVPA